MESVFSFHLKTIPMKKLMIPFLMAFSFLSFGQSMFSVGVITSADMTSLYTPTDAERNSVPFDQHLFGYQTGIRTQFNVNKMVSAQLGFGMVSHTIGTGKFPLHPLETGDPMVPNALERLVTFKSLQVPLTTSFYVGTTFRFGFTLGIAYHYVYRLDEKGYAYFANETMVLSQTSRLNANNQYLSAIAAFGVEYTYKRMLFRLEPTGCFQLTRLEMAYLNGQSRLWSGGLALTSFYCF